MFIGRDGFYWWIGTVEDNDDPLLLNRVKVRIFGYHPPYTATESADRDNTIPSSDLPWATVILSPNSSGNFSRLELGEWVFGFFLDGPEAQEPAVLGYMPTQLAEGAVPSAQSFGKYPTTKRTFSEVANQASSFNNPTEDRKRLSQRKSFFSPSGHSLEFLDYAGSQENRIDLRHNNRKTAVVVKTDDVEVQSNYGNYNVASKLSEIDGLKTRLSTLEKGAGSRSLSPYGYEKLPSGLIMQWGKVAVGSWFGTAVVTFPIGFSQVFNVQATPVAPGGLRGAGDKRDSFNIYEVTTSQFVMFSGFENGRGTVGYSIVEYYWFAVGI
jgi:hypothetical protein